jgi:hypothetical protein
VAADREGVLMAKKSLIGLIDLRLAFEKAGLVPQPASPPDPERHPVEDLYADIPPELLIHEHDQPRAEWVAQPHNVAAGRVISEYDPWKRGLR